MSPRFVALFTAYPVDAADDVASSHHLPVRHPGLLHKRPAPLTHVSGHAFLPSSKLAGPPYERIGLGIQGACG